MCKKKTENLS